MEIHHHISPQIQQWISQWKILTHSTEITPSITQSLIVPLERGDPVFCTSLCTHLLKIDFLFIFLQNLIPNTPSPLRRLQCEVIFNLCRCTSADCRLFIANCIPWLLWLEWKMAFNEEVEDFPLENDLVAVRIALLAAYQQDYGVNPIATNTRIISFDQRTIYRDGTAPAELHDGKIFPFNIEKGQEPLFPGPSASEPVEHFDNHTRSIITHRICRYFQDHSPQISPLSLAVYGLFIAKISVIGTKLDTEEMRNWVENGLIFGSSLKLRSRNGIDRRSDLSFQVHNLNLTEEDTSKEASDILTIDHSKCIRQIFCLHSSNPLLRKRYVVRESLFLLWTDCLPLIKNHFPSLEVYIRNCLLSRARVQAFSRALLALDL